MAPLTDPDQLEQIVKALRQPRACVSWKRSAGEWLRTNLDGETQQSIESLMLDHVETGGEIDRQPETRPEYRDRWAYHFDFRFDVSGRLIYVETVLDDQLIVPELTIVSIHDA